MKRRRRCCIRDELFDADPRVGTRLRACGRSDCQWERHRKDGEPHIYVTRPSDLSLERLDEMLRVCRRLGPTLRVDSAVAWHNPTAVLIEVLRA